MIVIFIYFKDNDSLFVGRGSSSHFLCVWGGVEPYCQNSPKIKTHIEEKFNLSTDFKVYKLCS